MEPSSKFQGARTIGKSLRPVVTSICKKKGFFYAELILDWTKIVGESYSRECRPLRVSGQKPHCCLYIGASRAVSAQMVYDVPTLLERIQQYFGCKIVETIKFIDDYAAT